jgi:hypothetical protein
MRSLRVVALLPIATVVLASCTGSGARYENAEHLASAIERSGLGCTDAGVPRGFPPSGETQLVCTVEDKRITIHVMKQEEGLQRIKRLNSGGNDEVPRVFWLYGQNWFIATHHEDVLKVLEVELGGDVTDNTAF